MRRRGKERVEEREGVRIRGEKRGEEEVSIQRVGETDFKE